MFTCFKHDKESSLSEVYESYSLQLPTKQF